MSAFGEKGATVPQDKGSTHIDSRLYRSVESGILHHELVGIDVPSGCPVGDLRGNLTKVSVVPRIERTEPGGN